MLKFELERDNDKNFPWVATQTDNKTLYAIDFFRHLYEAKEWCAENVKASNWKSTDSEYSISFRHEGDAFAFKMRWG